LNYNVTNLSYFAIEITGIAGGSLSISFTDSKGSNYWPAASNAQSPRYNWYSSLATTIIVYDLGRTFSSNLSSIHLHVDRDPLTAPNTTVGINVTSAYLAALPPEITVDSTVSLLSNHNLVANPVVMADHVVNATSSFFLLFNEMYDSSWVASAGARTSPNYLHFQANVYENVWLIDKTGSFDIAVRYTPQTIIDYSAWLGTILTSALVAFVAIIHYRATLRKLFSARIRMVASKLRRFQVERPADYCRDHQVMVLCSTLRTYESTVMEMDG
jgi:hypothetical protein